MLTDRNAQTHTSYTHHCKSSSLLLSDTQDNPVGQNLMGCFLPLCVIVCFCDGQLLLVVLFHMHIVFYFRCLESNI